MELRRAEPSDARAIAEVHVLAWQVAYAGLLPAEFLARLSVDEREARWHWNLGRGALARVTLLVDQGAVLGFSSVGATRERDVPEGYGELYALYLHPDRWRGGLGARLHDAAMDEGRALGFRALTLWVLEGNARARAFYEAKGWAPEGKRAEFTAAPGVAAPELRYHRTLG
ncbi:MAG: GNAT family N-acetyltransferase [Deltaproteobacteria bacterium]|nr:GNAT family N-acetyltransferase [Deltaproteobacteria bacterium]